MEPQVNLKSVLIACSDIDCNWAITEELQIERSSPEMLGRFHVNSRVRNVVIEHHLDTRGHRDYSVLSFENGEEQILGHIFAQRHKVTFREFKSFMIEEGWVRSQERK